MQCKLFIVPQTSSVPPPQWQYTLLIRYTNGKCSVFHYSTESGGIAAHVAHVKLRRVLSVVLLGGDAPLYWHRPTEVYYNLPSEM